MKAATRSTGLAFPIKLANSVDFVGDSGRQARFRRKQASLCEIWKQGAECPQEGYPLLGLQETGAQALKPEGEGDVVFADNCEFRSNPLHAR